MNFLLNITLTEVTLFSLLNLLEAFFPFLFYFKNKKLCTSEGLALLKEATGQDFDYNPELEPRANQTALKKILSLVHLET